MGQSLGFGETSFAFSTVIGSGSNLAARPTVSVITPAYRQAIGVLLIIRMASRAMSFASIGAVRSALENLVAHIVVMCPQPKVGWIAAGRVIAAVANANGRL
jgi:hypothetical protein